jgi:hypothetical protein
VVGRVASIDKKRNMYRGLAEKTDGNKPLGTPTGRWEDNSKMVKVMFTL